MTPPELDFIDNFLITFRHKQVVVKSGSARLAMTKCQFKISILFSILIEKTF